jgi:predicted DCC family thiol-disulfide oxidoreductase YuxK
MTLETATEKQARPILLFDDECGVCRRIARWVTRSALLESGEASIVERPLGGDPDALRTLNPDLDIWKAYETIHLLMPDGSMKLGGEAVAEVLRNLRATRWFAGVFAIRVFGVRPFQWLLDLAYAILADIRPLFGCDSCGMPSRWVRAIRWMYTWPKRGPSPAPHFTPLSRVNRP